MEFESDDAFTQAFEACTIPKSEWSHRAHVRMAWFYLRGHDFETALEKIRNGIRKYNQAVGGSPQGYHETVTQLYARLIRYRLERARSLTWDQFADANPALFDRKEPPSLKHYRNETLMSDAARASFIEPDLEPLP